MLTCPSSIRPIPHVTSTGPAGQAASLSSLPNDIHHLILSELAEVSPAGVLQVAQVAKTLHDAAIPIMYRHVTLERGSKSSKKKQAYQTLVKKFRQDDHGELSRHVRGITVKDGVLSDDLMMLLGKMAQFGNLQWLNWETCAHMPSPVFDLIHTTWPVLVLRVAAVDRQYAKLASHRGIDTRLLSSPLLVELTYTVYEQGYDDSTPCRSDWPAVSRALAAGGNVRRLRLQSAPDGDRYSDTRVVSDAESSKLPRIDFSSGLRLSRLEELSIQVKRQWWQGSTYLWDDEHCGEFLGFLDTSRLRRLDFGGDNPEAFFRTFTGRLPGLKSLRFGAVEGASGPAQAFIKSLDALEHLEIAQAQLAIDELWSAIEQHSVSLRTLILQPALSGYCSARHIDLQRLEAIAANFPKLERLGWDAPCGENIDTGHLAVLSSMRLKKLDLYLHIPGTANAYSAKLVQNAMGTIAPPPLDKQSATAAAIGIAEVVSDAQQDSLEWLTLHLARTGYSDRCQVYMMYSRLQLRRTAYDGVEQDRRWERRGEMEWYGWPSLREDLLFERE